MLMHGATRSSCGASYLKIQELNLFLRKIVCRTSVVLSIFIALAFTPSSASPSQLEHGKLSFGRHRYQRAWNHWPWGNHREPDSNFTKWDRLESVRESNPFNNQNTEKQAENHIDGVCRRFVSFVGYIVAIQSFSKFLSSNNNLFWDEMISQVMSKERAQAIKKIRGILSKAYDGGLADMFTKYRTSDLWTSIYAFSRLQQACKRYDAKFNETTLFCNEDTVDVELLDNLAHYAVYANAAYGTVMDLAFGGEFHLRGNLQNLLMRTKIPKGDFIAANWKPSNHPAYFIVRDRIRKKLVLCLRGTWSAQDVLFDLCCEADDLIISESMPRRSLFYPREPKPLRAHHGMVQAAKSVQVEVEQTIRQELDERPDYELVLVGHSMGGGVAAILGRLWESTFPGLVVYLIGAPCVMAEDVRASSAKIISVVHDYDPFSRLSLGHVMDLTIAVLTMCEQVDLREDIIERTSVCSIAEMSEKDLLWCHKTMTKIRSRMTSEKLYPPGRVFLLSFERPSRRHKSLPRLREVSIKHFQDLLLRPRMFDLTRHVPYSYIKWLRQLSEQYHNARS